MFVCETCEPVWSVTVPLNRFCLYMNGLSAVNRFIPKQYDTRLLKDLLQSINLTNFLEVRSARETNLLIVGKKWNTFDHS